MGSLPPIQNAVACCDGWTFISLRRVKLLISKTRVLLTYHGEKRKKKMKRKRNEEFEWGRREKKNKRKIQNKWYRLSQGYA